MSFAQPFRDYHILDRVGSGASGTVFKARHKRLDRVVALKVLRPGLARSVRFVDRLRREARIVANLDHPNIVKGYDLGTDGGYHYFVMEFVEGKSLRELLQEWGLFAEDRVLDVAIQLTSALEHAHTQGVTHRDIKPGNVLIDGEGRAKLTDMGLAKTEADLTLTREGATVGTPQYVSPEQARDPQAADIRSDLYSLGATLFHMATGAAPFEGENVAQVLSAVLTRPAPDARELNPDLSDGSSLVIRKLLSKDPEVRYQTPTALMEDLRRVRDKQAPDVDRRRLDAADPKLQRRWRARWPLQLAALAVAVLVGVWFGRRDGGGGTGVDSGSAVERELAALDTPGARWRRVLSWGASGSGAAVPEVLIGRLRSTVTEELRRTSLAVLDRYLVGDRQEQARAWFDRPENWRDSDRFLVEVVAPEFDRVVGLGRAELPPPVATEVDRRVDSLLGLFTRWREPRDAAYLVGIDDYLASASATWRAALTARDYASAERALRDGLRDVFGRGGRPERAQLPDALRAAVENRLARVRAAAEAAIDAAEQQMAGALLQSGLAATGRIERALDGAVGDSVERCDDRLRQLQADLGRFPPEAAFRVEHNPWPKVRFAIDGLRARVAERRVDAEVLGLDRATRLAYRTLVARGPWDAVAWLEPLAMTAPERQRRRDRHLRCLNAASRVMSALLPAEASPAVAGGWAVVEDSRGHRELRDGRGRARGPVELDWSELAARSEAWRQRVAADDVALGLAMVAALRGQPPRIEAIDDVALRRFFVEEVTVELAAVLEDRPAGPSAGPRLAALARIRAALDRAEPSATEVRFALDAYLASADGDSQPTEALALVRTAQRFLTTADRRQLVLGRLREVFGPSAEFDLTAGADQSEEVEVRMNNLQDPASLGLPAGSWRGSSAGLEFIGRDVELAGGTSGWVLPLPFDLDHRCRVHWRLRFPRAADHARVYCFGFGRTVVAIGILRDGRVLGVVAERLDQLEDRLRAALDGVPEHGGPHVVDGVATAVRLELEPHSHDAVKLRVSVRDTPLVESRVDRSRFAQGVTFRPLQPIGVDRVTLGGVLGPQ